MSREPSEAGFTPSEAGFTPSEAEHLNAIQDLAYAPLAYIKEAMEKSERSVKRLEDELEAQRAEIAALSERLTSLLELAEFGANSPHKTWNKE